MANISTCLLSVAVLCVLAASTMACTVTEAQYSSLRDGMTYDEAKEIIGCDGREFAPNAYEGAKKGKQVSRHFYRMATDPPDLSIEFRDGKLVDKRRFRFGDGGIY